MQAEVAAGSFSGFCSIVASGCGACAAVKPLLLRAVPVACAGQQSIRTALEKHGFALESVCDGETFGPLTEDSQRYFFCAVKQYTQLEG